MNSEFPGFGQCSSSVSQMLTTQQLHPSALGKKQFASETFCSVTGSKDVNEMKSKWLTKRE